MIVTEQKPIREILENLKTEKDVFLMGCGECSTTCKTGGEKELIRMRETLAASGINVTGSIIPKAPCVASQVIGGLAKYRKELEGSDSILVMACGGVNKGKCEVDKNRDCAWVLIYNELREKNRLSDMRKIQSPRDYSRSIKPHIKNLA